MITYNICLLLKVTDHGRCHLKLKHNAWHDGVVCVFGSRPGLSQTVRLLRYSVGVTRSQFRDAVGAWRAALALDCAEGSSILFMFLLFKGRLFSSFVSSSVQGEDWWCCQLFPNVLHVRFSTA